MGFPKNTGGVNQPTRAPLYVYTALCIEKKCEREGTSGELEEKRENISGPAARKQITSEFADRESKSLIERARAKGPERLRDSLARGRGGMEDVRIYTARVYSPTEGNEYIMKCKYESIPFLR